MTDERLFSRHFPLSTFWKSFLWMGSLKQYSLLGKLDVDFDASKFMGMLRSFLLFLSSSDRLSVVAYSEACH
jgi:regulatory protein YycH of two-component signal transduction system YycFG